MENISTTSPAQAAVTSIPELRERLLEAEERLHTAEVRKQSVEREVGKIRFDISVLVAQEQRADDLERSASPKTFEDLRRDPSYRDDEYFKPNDVDEVRFSNFLRGKAARGDVEKNEKTISEISQLQATGMNQAGALRRDIERINGSMIRRSLNWLTGTRESSERMIADIESQLNSAPKRLEETNIALAKAREIAGMSGSDGQYDVSLHEREAIRFLPRRQQSVLMTYEKDTKGKHLVDFHIPRTPGDASFGRTIRLEIDDVYELAEFIGYEIPLQDGIFLNVIEYMSREWEFKNELVPFPLEVVEVDGEEQFRLPQVVWEKFKDSVTK